MHKPALISGTIFAALAVILGAFGAHALKETLSAENLTTFETGVKYQFYHSFAMLITGILFTSFPFKQIKLAATFFTLGIILFSGSIYLLVFLKHNGNSLGPAGMITPIGGLFFILGWLFLLIGVMKRSS